MKKKDLLELIKTIQDDQEVDDTLKESELAKKFGGLEAVKEKVKSDKDFKSWLDSEKDKHLQKGIETFKGNNLQKLVEEEYKKQHPEADPKDSELAKMRKQLEDMQKEAVRKDLTNKAIKIATEKKLPVELVDFIVGENEESTNKNLETLTTIFTKYSENIKTELLKNNSYVPPGGGADNKPGAFGLKLAAQNTVKDTNLDEARASYFK